MLYAPEARDSLPRGRTARRVRRVLTAHLGTTGPRQPRGRPCARLGAPALLHRRAARDAGRLGAARHGLLRTATATEALPSARWAMHYGGAPRPRACALHVYRMCTACVLHLHCMCTAYALPAHCMGLTRTCTAALLGARRADQLGILRARHRLPGARGCRGCWLALPRAGRLLYFTISGLVRDRLSPTLTLTLTLTPNSLTRWVSSPSSAP